METCKRGEKYTLEKELVYTRPPWKDTDILMHGKRPLCTSETPLGHNRAVCKALGLHETGGAKWGWGRRGGGVSWDKWCVFFYYAPQYPLNLKREHGWGTDPVYRHAAVERPYLSCSASWPFCTSWTQQWWDRVLCPWVVSLQCAASGFPDPTYSHRFCFSWCRLPTRSTGPPHSPLWRHIQEQRCAVKTAAKCR